ncbi:MAG TPA: glycosyl hydrolase family 18 protein [Candidatus Dormibacteraeota bacterium]|nr:glycosyl hydrolase family 18 protein [Candidatus Dormibacteraeota bacterium]
MTASAALAGCSEAATSPQPSGSGSGIVVVTAGGTALVDGQSDVPPTLDLRLSTSAAPGDVHATLDGAALALAAAGQGAFTGSVKPLPLGSAHSLGLDISGRGAQTLTFHVVPPAGAQAAVHSDTAGTVLDLAFQFAPDRPSVEAALPPGPAVTWSDDSHVTAAWPTAPGGSFSLPATVATARGSHLAAALSVSLAPVAPGALRRAVVPAPAAGAPQPVVVAFTVGTAASRASLAAHAARISVASPTGLQVGSDGTVTGTPDQPAVATAAAAGVPLWPLIQNDASDSAGIAALLESAAARGRLVSSAVELATTQGYGGIHLDIEGVPSGDRDRLSDLVDALGKALHGAGRKLAVAVVPHKPGHLNAYSAAYDLARISAAADLVTLMAYDEHTSLTGAGAVAGLAWDQQVVAGSLGEMRSTATALLGLPLYARAWGSGDTVADSYANSVRTALAAPGGRVDYDFGAATPYIHHGDDPSSTTWFDDSLSLTTKLALVGSLHLHGVALWRLGFEDPALWNVLPARAVRP